MFILLILLTFAEGFNIPLTRDHWKVSYPHIHNMKIDFFCNKTNYACPYTPPSHPSNWLQLVSPFPGSDRLVYEFKSSEFSKVLELTDFYALVDKDPALRQNGTFSIRLGSQYFNQSLGDGWDWTNLTIPLHLDHLKDTRRTLEIILELDTQDKRTLSVVVIGGISIT